MIVPGILVCSSFLISVCMFIVSKVLLISSATVIVHAGGAIWLNTFATVLFSVCSAVTVECCVLYPCCMGVFGMFAVMSRHSFMTCTSRYTVIRHALVETQFYDMPGRDTVLRHAWWGAVIRHALIVTHFRHA